MTKKLLDFQDVLKEELKDKEFKKYYEEEGRRLELGYKIANLRQKQGLTQKELAEKVHTSQATVARLEGGEYLGYSLRTLEKIALATGTHLEIRFR
ncbi:MAG: helix-turn-helix transcriptional regulator [Candidatus Omnitrophica bacterium]|nr:helix-turn-helix transcriptional regulator [Candidatus Omnitrophota bacterium]MBU0878678.1 helix-turn-helix transcriptional regulator [Candidatus Omnitrophota bacterium]MBU0896918.1 helix-turn-helix transcriptional regulator [Candidatus Omnitrophota bacterium]MBU1134314.1 helix-turn-helix transcriptional regulator [Candidatus Omnitrophota bacterium]MBU1367598.1 helix-turn-helix transcriptional regulator [Candidatus Omnitrophota bacterium]